MTAALAVIWEASSLDTATSKSTTHVPANCRSDDAQPFKRLASCTETEICDLGTFREFDKDAMADLLTCALLNVTSGAANTNDPAKVVCISVDAASVVVLSVMMVVEVPVMICPPSCLDRVDVVIVVASVPVCVVPVMTCPLSCLDRVDVVVLVARVSVCVVPVTMCPLSCLDRVDVVIVVARVLVCVVVPVRMCTLSCLDTVDVVIVVARVPVCVVPVTMCSLSCLDRADVVIVVTRVPVCVVTVVSASQLTTSGETSKIESTDIIMIVKTSQRSRRSRDPAAID